MSDKFSRNLTITLLVFLILYYKYVRFIINQKGEYNQNKCDPLNLVIGGIIGSASDDMFEKFQVKPLVLLILILILMQMM